MNNNTHILTNTKNHMHLLCGQLTLKLFRSRGEKRRLVPFFFCCFRLFLGAMFFLIFTADKEERVRIICAVCQQMRQKKAKSHMPVSEWRKHKSHNSIFL